jgi:hypothetical protein
MSTAPEVIVNPAMTRPRKILYLAPGPDPQAVYRTRLKIAAFLEPRVIQQGDHQATAREFLRAVLPLQSHVAADHLHEGRSLMPVVRSFDPDSKTGDPGRRL